MRVSERTPLSSSELLSGGAACCSCPKGSAAAAGPPRVQAAMISGAKAHAKRPKMRWCMRRKRRSIVSSSDASDVHAAAE